VFTLGARVRYVVAGALTDRKCRGSTFVCRSASLSCNALVHAGLLTACAQFGAAR
jgi:hypothetical protein